MSERENLDKMKRLFQSENFFDDFVDMVSDDCIFTLIGGGSLTGTYSGKKAIEDFFVPVKELLPNGLKFNVRNMLAQGDVVIVEWEDSGITKDGMLYENTGIQVFEFKGGKIQTMREYIEPENLNKIL